MTINEIYSVYAAGTSEGVKKSWEKRHILGVVNGESDVKSKDATEKFSAAKKNGDDEPNHGSWGISEHLGHTTHSRRWKFEGDKTGKNGHVFWTHDNHSKEDDFAVEDHLAKHHGVTVKSHKLLSDKASMWKRGVWGSETLSVESIYGRYR